ncbi:MAG: hypothetical protein HC893_06130 [Chloroflexaceae bacterium]|nr:hypothetical protein [Chloroflexaceae bacterium]
MDRQCWHRQDTVRADLFAAPKQYCQVGLDTVGLEGTIFKLDQPLQQKGRQV